MKDPGNYPDAAERAFSFRLARDLGMTVAELERRMSAAEFVEWVAYYVAENKEQESAMKKARKK